MPERLRIGSAEIAVARDADFRFAPAAFLRDAAGQEIAKEAWQPHLGARDPNEIEESRVLTFVIRSRGKTILVDAGVGPWGLWRFGDGHLLESLTALDVAPESIDVVLPTHLHPDHVGWNTRPSPNGPIPTFPRARYLFQRADWDHFTNPDFLSEDNPRTQMIRTAVLPLKDTGLMDLVGSEATITEEVTLLHTPGHTPGSVSVLVQSGGEAALLLGDAAHHSIQLTETDWSPLADLDPRLAARSRKAAVDQAVRLNAYVAGAHFAASDPSFGRMIPLEGRMIWQGVELPESR
jgi:glyoxylase-like metal-dependent hydrolase (beta-lactamase superfamily II)